MRATVNCNCLIACLISVLLMTASEGSGAERPAWANADLTVTEGLALWLDASVQNAALAPFGVGDYITGARMAKWLDGSGHDRHLL